MAIKKQEFYEGAALFLLVRTGQISSIKYNAPFFICNNKLSLLLKYTTKGRSPWQFTVTADEQAAMKSRSAESSVVIGMICGSDGVATLDFDSYLQIAIDRTVAVHISCYRKHNEHYEINGPDGTLSHKIAPSHWMRILENEN